MVTISPRVFANLFKGILLGHIPTAHTIGPPRVTQGRKRIFDRPVVGPSSGVQYSEISGVKRFEGPVIFPLETHKGIRRLFLCYLSWLTRQAEQSDQCKDYDAVFVHNCLLFKYKLEWEDVKVLLAGENDNNNDKHRYGDYHNQTHYDTNGAVDDGEPAAKVSHTKSHSKGRSSFVKGYPPLSLQKEFVRPIPTGIGDLLPVLAKEE